MKSLDQLEPRTPIGAVGESTATIAINQPGSYVLMGNLKVTDGDGIMINADNVTLDLNGFTISSTEATPTGYGIRLGSSYTVPGVGLSLAICRETMAKLGGRITVDSESAHGATFTIWLRPA